jgi:CRISPR type I-E-associated protein CasB/Cse2
MDRRVVALLDTSWNPNDSFFSSKISRLVRMLKQKGLSPDFAVLLKDLLLWNHPSRIVQKSWARMYFGDINIQKTKEEEN